MLLLEIERFDLGFHLHTNNTVATPKSLVILAVKEEFITEIPILLLLCWILCFFDQMAHYFGTRFNWSLAFQVQKINRNINFWCGNPYLLTLIEYDLDTGSQGDPQFSYTLSLLAIYRIKILLIFDSSRVSLGLFHM